MHTMLMDKKVDVPNALRALGILTNKKRDALDEEARLKLLHKALDHAQNLDNLKAGKKVNFDVLDSWDKSKKLFDEFKQFSFMEGVTGKAHNARTHQEMESHIEKLFESMDGLSLESPHQIEEHLESFKQAEQHFYDLRQSFWSIGKVIDEKSKLSVPAHLYITNHRSASSRTKLKPARSLSSF